jgi:hypothetical protein
MSADLNLISLPISGQSRTQRDQSRKREPVSCETICEIDIRSISVRIVKTKFACTDVLKSTSARVLESLKTCYALIYPNPPKKGRDLKSAHRDDGDHAAIEGLRWRAKMRQAGAAPHAADTSRSYEVAQKRPFFMRSATVVEMRAGGSKISLKSGGRP